MKRELSAVLPLVRRLRVLAPGFRRIVQSASVVAFAAAALGALAPDAFAQEPKIDLETRFQKCLDAGWGVNRGNKLCQIRVRHGDTHIGYNIAGWKPPIGTGAVIKFLAPTMIFRKRRRQIKG